VLGAPDGKVKRNKVNNFSGIKELEISVINELNIENNEQ